MNNFHKSTTSYNGARDGPQPEAGGGGDAALQPAHHCSVLGMPAFYEVHHLCQVRC